MSDAAVRLDGLSPLTILGRGYAIATRTDGRALRSAADVAVGDEIRIRLGRGSIGAGVESITLDREPPDPFGDTPGSVK